MAAPLLASPPPPGTPPATAPLVVHFMDQPPSSGPDADGKPAGELVERMRLVEQRAGLALRWQLTPLKRSLHDLRANREPFCVLGLFRSAEREGFAQFSRVLLAGVPQTLVARREVAARLRQLGSARAALQGAELRLLVYDGVSYGEEIDGWLRERQGPTVRAVAGTLRLFDMLGRNRADFAITTVRGFEQWRLDLAPGAEGLERLDSLPLPPPPSRHLACSRRVPEAQLRAVDRALEALDAR